MPGARMAGAVPLVTGPHRTRRFFDRLAPAYDGINTRIYKLEWLAKVRESLRGRVLDVGVGTGFTTGHMPNAVGIDLSREMLRRGRYVGDLARADFLHPPFREKTFDTVVFAGSFYYLADPLAGLRTAATLLRRGGRVLILSPASRLFAPMVPVYSREDYTEFLEEAGFRLDTYQRLNWAACFVRASKT